MELGIAFLVFIVSMVGAIIFDLTMIAPLLVGLAAFLIVGVRKGFSLKEMARMGWRVRNHLRQVAMDVRG